MCGGEEGASEWSDSGGGGGGGGGGIPIGRQSLEVGRKGGEVQNWEDTMHVPVSMQKT